MLLLRSLFAAALTVLVGLVGSCCTAQAAARLSIREALREVSGWTIGNNEAAGGCLAATTYRDNTTIWIGFDGKGGGTIGFTNPAWKSIEPGQSYAIAMFAYGAGNWQGTFYGTVRSNEKGIVAENTKLDFLKDLARAGGVVVQVNGRPVAKLSLSGSSAALDAVASCMENDRSRTASSSDKHDAGDSALKATGTGFFVSENGDVITNFHVIDECTLVRVSYSSSFQEEARVVARDKANDLALLSTIIKPMFVPAFSTRPEIGESVFVFGFPFLGVLASSGNFTIGNVTANAGLGDDTSQLQVSAPIQPGNSGGALLDQKGSVLGIIVSKLNPDAVKDIPQNVNFAIKSAIAVSFLESNNVNANTKVMPEPLESTKIAKLAQSFTVRVYCY